MFFWRKKFKIRRCGDVGVVNGYQAYTTSEFWACMNVQEQMPNRMSPADEGKSTGMSLQSYSDVPFRVADDVKQSNADMLEYKDEWYECVSCNLFDNTMLHHYVSSWTRIPKEGEEA